MKAQKLLHFLRGTYWPLKILCLALYKKSYQVSVTNPVKLLAAAAVKRWSQLRTCGSTSSAPFASTFLGLRPSTLAASVTWYVEFAVPNSKIAQHAECHIHLQERKITGTNRGQKLIFGIRGSFNYAFDSRCFMIFYKFSDSILRRNYWRSVYRLPGEFIKLHFFNAF